MHHTTSRSASSVAPSQRTIPWVNFWVACATPSVILAAIASPVMARTITQVGRLGEDLLRGERLPLLHFPPDAPSDAAGRSRGKID